MWPSSRRSVHWMLPNANIHGLRLISVPKQTHPTHATSGLHLQTCPGRTDIDELKDVPSTVEPQPKRSNLEGPDILAFLKWRAIIKSTRCVEMRGSYEMIWRKAQINLTNSVYKYVLSHLSSNCCLIGELESAQRYSCQIHATNHRLDWGQCQKLTEAKLYKP